jgi:hypothetical protein
MTPSGKSSICFLMKQIIDHSYFFARASHFTSRLEGIEGCLFLLPPNSLQGLCPPPNHTTLTALSCDGSRAETFFPRRAPFLAHPRRLPRCPSQRQPRHRPSTLAALPRPLLTSRKLAAVVLTPPLPPPLTRYTTCYPPPLPPDPKNVL